MFHHFVRSPISSIRGEKALTTSHRVLMCFIAASALVLSGCGSSNKTKPAAPAASPAIADAETVDGPTMEEITADAIAVAMAIIAAPPGPPGGPFYSEAAADNYMVDVARTGDDVTVTVTDPKGTDEIADDEKLMAAETPPHAIDGWHGARFMRGEATEYVTVYTNIDAPGDEKYEEYYAAVDDRDGVTAIDDGVLTLDIADVEAAAKLGLYSAAMFPTLGRQFATYPGDDPDTDVDESEQRMFAGTFHGVPGMYLCMEVTDGCTATADNDGNLATLTGSWMFTPTDYKADKYMVRGVTDDADYLHFGYWLESTEAEDGTTSYEFQAFSGGTPEFAMSDAVVGTAAYAGPAGGMYVRKVLTSTGEVETATRGSFTADTKLTANFGGNQLAPASRFSISGTVKNFMDGETSLDGWTVTLKPAPFAAYDTDNGSHTEHANTFTGTTTGSETANEGNWSGTFYGDSTVAEEVTPPQPSGVAGEFNGHFANGHVNGAFGAVKQP